MQKALNNRQHGSVEIHNSQKGTYRLESSFQQQSAPLSYNFFTKGSPIGGLNVKKDKQFMVSRTISDIIPGEPTMESIFDNRESLKQISIFNSSAERTKTGNPRISLTIDLVSNKDQNTTSFGNMTRPSLMNSSALNNFDSTLSSYISTIRSKSQSKKFKLLDAQKQCMLLKSKTMLIEKNNNELRSKILSLSGKQSNSEYYRRLIPAIEKKAKMINLSPANVEQEIFEMTLKNEHVQKERLEEMLLRECPSMMAKSQNKEIQILLFQIKNLESQKRSCEFRKSHHRQPTG